MGEPGQLDPDILEGRAEEVPPLSSKIVRVFLSSTFSGNNYFYLMFSLYLQHVYISFQVYSGIGYR